MEEKEKIAPVAVEGVETVVEPVVVTDPIAEKDKEIAKLKEDRDNYKAVALKRLGKLPGDAEFLAGTDKDKKELSVAEQIKIALLDKEIELNERAKDEEIKKIVRENGELKIALKNRPGDSIGSGSGNSGVEVKDNVFSAEQIIALKSRATKLGLDPDKFIENAKKNLLNKQKIVMLKGTKHSLVTLEKMRRRTPTNETRDKMIKSHLGLKILIALQLF